MHIPVAQNTAAGAKQLPAEAGVAGSVSIATFQASLHGSKDTMG